MKKPVCPHNRRRNREGKDELGQPWKFIQTGNSCSHQYLTRGQRKKNHGMDDNRGQLYDRDVFLKGMYQNLNINEVEIVK